MMYQNFLNANIEILPGISCKLSKMFYVRYIYEEINR